MVYMIKVGDCVKIPDGRIGRVRAKKGTLWEVRVKRETSETHKFILYKSSELKVIDCPAGWMSRDGYNNYLKKTLKKMSKRLGRKIN
jgi:hypothetical protein